MYSVDDIKKIPDKIRRLGVYKYNGRYYSNKYRALTDAGTNYINWVFNDDEFAKHDFSVEPNEDLYELYAKRAWQIRQKYDKVVIYYSGGIDSTAVLRAFVDNDVPIDAVVVYGAWSANNKFSDINRSEQERVGIPYLKHIEKERNIKLNVHFLDIVPFHQKYNEDWVYNNSYNLVPACSAFSYFDEDPFFQNLMMQGSVCTVRGVDKPRLIFEDNTWKLAFLDVTLGGVTSYSNYEDRKYYLLDEFFFWTPDYPEIVAKQAHIVARELEKRFTPAECEIKFTRSSKFDKIGFGNLVEPIVYGKYIQQKVGEERPYYYVPPAFSGVMNPKSWWFFNGKNELVKDNQLFVEGILQLQNTIDPMHFNKTPDDQSKIDIFHKNCPIDERLLIAAGKRDPLFGTVGCWSPDYFIKKYGHYEEDYNDSVK